MIELSALRDRYMRDALPTRLGGLEAHLARIKSFSDHPDHREIVKRIIVECEYFAEWTGLKADLKIQAKLVELQTLLAVWSYSWKAIWDDKEKLQLIAEQADDWAQEILNLSGLC